MFENFDKYPTTGLDSDNRKAYFDLEQEKIIIPGGDCTHYFELDFKADDYFDGIDLIYKQSLEKTLTLTYRKPNNDVVASETVLPGQLEVITVVNEDAEPPIINPDYFKGMFNQVKDFQVSVETPRTEEQLAEDRKEVAEQIPDVLGGTVIRKNDYILVEVPINDGTPNYSTDPKTPIAYYDQYRYKLVDNNGTSTLKWVWETKLDRSPDTYKTIIKATLTSEQTKDFVTYRKCMAQLKMFSWEGTAKKNITYGDIYDIVIKNTLDSDENKE